MKKNLEVLKNWIEKATKIYMTDHEANVQRVEKTTLNIMNYGKSERTCKAKLLKEFRCF